MSKLFKLLGLVVVAVIGYYAYDVYDCRAKSTTLQVESVYDIRKGCLFKTPDGYSSVYFKAKPK